MYASKKRTSTRLLSGPSMGTMIFLLVSFGLTNVPTNFTCLMNSVLHPYLETFVIVFIDDILIYSKKEEYHEKLIATILRLLKEH